MKPTKQLIRGLRETAAHLRDEANAYDWGNATRCNCGILASVILGIDGTELHARGAAGSWWHRACEAIHCEQTGLPIKQVFADLRAVGVELTDFYDIEFAGGALRNSDRFAVAAWMDAEADKLEARRAAGERPERGTP